MGADQEKYSKDKKNTIFDAMQYVGYYRKDKIRKKKITEKTKVTDISYKIKKLEHKFAGHMARGGDLIISRDISYQSGHPTPRREKEVAL